MGRGYFVAVTGSTLLLRGLRLARFSQKSPCMAHTGQLFVKV